jgi:hypothetical protein
MATDLCDVCGGETTRTPTGCWVCEPCDGITALRHSLVTALAERDEAREAGRHIYKWFVQYLVERNELSMCKLVASLDEQYPWLAEGEDGD